MNPSATATLQPLSSSVYIFVIRTKTNAAKVCAVWIVSSMSPLALFRLGRGAMLEVGFLFRAFSSEFFCFSSAFLTFAASLSLLYKPSHPLCEPTHQLCVSVPLLFASFSTLSPLFIFLFLLLLSASDFPSLSKDANIHCW